MDKNYASYITAYILGVIFILLLTSCAPSSDIDTTDDDYVAPMTGSVSESGSTTQQTGSITETPINSNTGADATDDIEWPIDDGEDRVTKKTFGLQVSPTSSPVSPEKFTGWHTGLDFETTEDERDEVMEIQAVCTGPLIYKDNASGYGGVAVQRCTLRNEPMTVLYGHLQLASITALLGTDIEAGDKIGILGKGFTDETDGERKHLHLSIHKGANVELKGYVPNQSDLDGWVDPMEYLE